MPVSLSSQSAESNFSRKVKGKSVVPAVSKYTEGLSLFSRSSVNRIQETEAERTQGTRTKCSQLNRQGKVVLKQRVFTHTSKVDLTAPPQPEGEFLLIGEIKVPISHIPYRSKQTSTGSVAEFNGSCSPPPSASTRLSFSESLAFKLPEDNVSLPNLKDFHGASTTSTPTSQCASKTQSYNGKEYIQEGCVFRKNEVSTSQGPSAAQHKHQPKVQATNQRPNNVSKGRVFAKNVRTDEHIVRRESLPDVDRTRPTASHSPIPKITGAVNLVKNETKFNINLLRSAAAVKAVKIFPSRLSLKSQERLVSILDSLQVVASNFVTEFIISSIKTDTLKSIQRNILISNAGRVHFFNNSGLYAGMVTVEEPVWFYGRLAGRSGSLYMSLGKGRTSKCFIKKRFPTLHEFLKHDWAEGRSSLKFVTVYDPVGKRNWLGSNTFCWLPLYLNNKVELTQIPTSGLVRLFTLQDRFGLVPILRTGKYYHYSPEGRTHKKFPNVLVGAEGAVTETTNTAWDGCLSDPPLRAAVDSIPVVQVEETSRSTLRRFFDFLAGVPGKIFSKLLSLILGVLPKHYRNKLEKFLSDEELLKDRPDVVVTNASVDNSKAKLDNEILQDLLSVVKDLTVLKAHKTEIVEVNDNEKDGFSVNSHVAELGREKAGLKEGGNAWYDFILPSETKSADGESLLVDLWRIVGKIDRVARGNVVMAPLIKALMVLLKGLVFVLKPAFQAFSGVKSTVKNSFSVKEAKKTLRKVISGFVLETLAKICNSLGLTYLCNLKSEVVSIVRSDISERIAKLEEDTDTFLKAKIASGLKALGLKYPKGWLDERHKLRVFFDAAWKAIKTYPLVPAAGCVLMLLLASKKLRERALKLPQEAFCFAERVRIGKPLVLISALIGSLIGKYSDIASLFVDLDGCREMSLGMLVPSLIHNIPSLWDTNATGQKLALLLKVSVFYKFFDVYKTVLFISDKEEPKISVPDVADVEPGLEVSTLNNDTEEVFENFRRSERARMCVNQSDCEVKIEDAQSASIFPAKEKIEEQPADKTQNFEESEASPVVDCITAIEAELQSSIVKLVEVSPSTSKGILVELHDATRCEDSCVYEVVEPTNTEKPPSGLVSKTIDTSFPTIHLPEIEEPLDSDVELPEILSAFATEDKLLSETIPMQADVESESLPVVERVIGKALVPELKTTPPSSRPLSQKPSTVGTTVSNVPLATSLEAITGVSFSVQTDFPNKNFFKNMCLGLFIFMSTLPSAEVDSPMVICKFMWWLLIMELASSS